MRTRGCRVCSRPSPAPRPISMPTSTVSGAAKLGVPAQRVFEALQVYLGSTYINDFNYLGRTYQVMAQADEAYRLTADDIGRYKTRNDAGEMVPIGSVATFHDTTWPYRVPRYNQFPAAEVQCNAAPGVSSGTAVAAME